VRLRKVGQRRILDFDIETVAAGFADPEWVPQKITCVAWSWIGEDKVESAVCGPAGIFGKPERRAKMLRPLLQALGEADMVTGHNIIRFDLPVIQAEVMRLGLPVLKPLLVQDTIKLHRSKGFKKGQDNLGRLYRIADEKLALDWQAWQDAYDEDGWQTIRDRAESDVRMHKQLRAALIDLDYLKEPRTWTP
jgi:DNA polymerase elongation subunit (family B)